MKTFGLINVFTRIICNNPNFTFNLIKGGSVGFAESYMKNDFVTDDLSNLIEFTARNINLFYVC